MLRYNGTEREAQPGACTGGPPRTLRPPLANKRAFCRQPLRTIANLRNSIDTDCSLCTSFFTRFDFHLQNWKSKTNLEKGLNKTFEWYFNNKKFYKQLSKV